MIKCRAATDTGLASGLDVTCRADRPDRTTSGLDGKCRAERPTESPWNSHGASRLVDRRSWTQWKTPSSELRRPSLSLSESIQIERAEAGMVSQKGTRRGGAKEKIRSSKEGRAKKAAHGT